MPLNKKVVFIRVARQLLLLRDAGDLFILGAFFLERALSFFISFPFFAVSFPTY